MTYVSRKDVRATEVEQELMLHDPIAKKVYVLNPTARVIWSLCDGAHTQTQMNEAVRSHFQTTTLDVSQDVQNALNWLRDYQLLEQ